MSRITASTDFDKVKQEDSPRYLTLFAQDVAKQLSNGLDFASNLNAKEITVNFTAANAEIATAHSLGRTPTRYIVTSATTGLSAVYNGTTANTSSLIYLKSSAIGVATILIY